MNDLDPTRPVRLAVVGAGNRGQAYAEWVRANPERATIVAVADPDPVRRRHVLGGDPSPLGTSGDSIREYDDWRDLLAGDQVADAAVVSTQDRYHLEPVLALIEAGYHVLLEKPMAPTEEECRKIVYAAQEAGVLLGVCHVLRYTPYTDLVKSVVDSGVLGAVTGVEHLEPVGWWHAAHSYVRGAWRREDEASPMLLAKSCHDLDWIRYVIGRRITTVASFGGRHHFRPDQRPEGAADRCLDCEVEPTCPYSAPRLYLGTLRDKGAVWPVSVITDADDEPGVIEALRTGPYGRCVYASDNDVVDHQVVMMGFEGGGSGTFTMTAFSEHTDRRTRLFGTHGSLEGDGERVRVVDFRDGSVRELDAHTPGGSDAGSGHGGGDGGVIDAFVQAVATGDASSIRSGPLESLESHLTVFAAERSRHAGTVVPVPAP